MNIQYFTKTTRNKYLLLLFVPAIVLSVFIYQNRFTVFNYWHIAAFVNGDFYQIKKAQMYFFDRGPRCLPFLVHHYHSINSDTEHKAALLSLIGTLSAHEFYELIHTYSYDNFLVLDYYDYENILKQLKRTQLMHIYNEYDLAVHKLKIKKSIDKILSKKEWE